ncbi:hypothetical protein [Actinomadura sp. SCN-SB]|uniref:hypothetical protein n=1 Tax=Actinomadura sp. SCN-SB TaxID=3373092 RepID=UPI0037532244
MRRKSRSKVVAVGLCGVMAASVAVAAPAGADTGTAACQINLSDPWRSGDWVTTGANVNGCPDGPWSITLQRQRWYGWEGLASNRFYNGGGSVASWNCAGSGSHNYIGRLSGPGGTISTAQVRISC